MGGDNSGCSCFKLPYCPRQTRSFQRAQFTAQPTEGRPVPLSTVVVAEAGDWNLNFEGSHGI